MMTFKKTITVISILGSALLISTSAFSLDGLSEFNILEKRVAGITCRYHLDHELFDCDVNRENISPKELYEALSIQEEVHMFCYTGVPFEFGLVPVNCHPNSDSSLIMHTHLEKNLSGISCTKREVTDTSNGLNSFMCQVNNEEEEHMDPQELYEALDVEVTHKKKCHQGAQPVECPGLLY